VSATNRGGKRSEADFYPTPAWCVDRLLEALPLPGGVWLEPAAGSGAIVKAVNAKRADVRWRVVELDARFAPELARETGKRAVITRSFLDVSCRDSRPTASVVITNPPYSIALPMIQHALDFDALFVVMLLRLNFLASAARADLMRSHAPDVYVLPNRPSFSGSGTDSIEYAWFVWHGRKHRPRGVVSVLAPTSAEKRAGGQHEDAASAGSNTRAKDKELRRSIGRPI
jgi:hypothetical protein